MPTARVDTILYMADRNDSRKITLLMNTCCEFFSWPKSLIKPPLVASFEAGFSMRASVCSDQSPGQIDSTSNENMTYVVVR